MIIRIYRQEESDEVAGCTIIERAGGPKRYQRIWDAYPSQVEWGWTLHPSAVMIWP